MTDVTATSGSNEAEANSATQAPVEGTTQATEQTTQQTQQQTQEQTTKTEEKVVAPTWRDDWRQAMAGADAKELERLQRIASPEALHKSYRELEKKMSGLKVPPTLPDKPTPEQLTEYRKAIGVPEKPEGYLEKLPNGLVIGEEDKPAMAYLAEKLHGKNVSPDVVSDVVEAYYEIIEKNFEDMVEVQRALKQNSEDALRAEWGADYRPTINAVKAMLDGVDQDTKELVEGMQLADGSLAFNHPGFMRWLGSMVLQINPAALVMPGQSGGDKMATVKQQIADNQAEMSKNINAWQSKGNEARRQEHTRLIDAAIKMGMRV